MSFIATACRSCSKMLAIASLFCILSGEVYSPESSLQKSESSVLEMWTFREMTLLFLSDHREGQVEGPHSGDTLLYPQNCLSSVLSKSIQMPFKTTDDLQLWWSERPRSLNAGKWWDSFVIRMRLCYADNHTVKLWGDRLTLVIYANPSLPLSHVNSLYYLRQSKNTIIKTIYLLKCSRHPDFLSWEEIQPLTEESKNPPRSKPSLQASAMCGLPPVGGKADPSPFQPMGW